MNQVKYWLEQLLDKGRLLADLEKAAKAYQVGNRTTALAKLTPLAEAEHEQAQFILGLISYDDGEAQDYAEALKWFSLAKKKEYLPAYCLLAEMYRYGKGVEQDDAEARELYHYAADSPVGVVEARYEMGMILIRSKNRLYFGEAAQWFDLAAKDGSVEAQYEMGVNYEYGRGVKINTDVAYRWYHLAAIQGHEKAKESWNRIAKNMTPRQIAEIQKTAEHMAERHEKEMVEEYKTHNPYAIPHQPNF